MVCIIAAENKHADTVTHMFSIMRSCLMTALAFTLVSEASGGGEYAISSDESVLTSTVSRFRNRALGYATHRSDQKAAYFIPSALMMDSVSRETVPGEKNSRTAVSGEGFINAASRR
jgi:hypothetical protein